MKDASKPQFTITKMTLEEVEPATAMRLQSWLDTYVNDAVGVTQEWILERNRKQMTPEFMEARKKRFLSVDMTGWVAKNAEGKIIGVTNPYVDEAGLQHVGSLYVDKNYHRLGIGSELLKKVIEQSDPKKPIVIGVVSYNDRAIIFYKKWGFVEITNSETHFDGIIPEIMMSRKGDQQ